MNALVYHVSNQIMLRKNKNMMHNIYIEKKTTRHSPRFSPLKSFKIIKSDSKQILEICDTTLYNMNNDYVTVVCTHLMQGCRI